MRTAVGGQGAQCRYRGTRVVIKCHRAHTALVVTRAFVVHVRKRAIGDGA